MWKNRKAGYRFGSEPDLRGELLAAGAEDPLWSQARQRFGAKRQE
jgi:hypothetical protein